MGKTTKLSRLAAEFVGLMRLLSWNQSETARRLFITPSHVNQICHGRAEPSAAMVQLLKLTALRLRPDLKSRLDAELDEKPGREEKLAELAELDEAGEFWEMFKQKRLKKLSPERRAELLNALAVLLRLPYRHGRRNSRRGRR